MKFKPPPNWEMPVVAVEHGKMTLLPGSESVYKRLCPFCPYGMFLMTRDADTGRLLELDRCVSCGQRVRWMDIAEVRALEGDKKPS